MESKKTKKRNSKLYSFDSEKNAVNISLHELEQSDVRNFTKTAEKH